MSFKLHQIDAFCHLNNQEGTFSGNPAAVCLLDQDQPTSWMQDVAEEMNLSETAFLKRQGDGFDLRWFTPLAEVDLCGHATLASAHFLWETGTFPRKKPLYFSTRSGILSAKETEQGIQIDLPSDPQKPIRAPEGLNDALGIPPESVGITTFDLLVEVKDEETVRQLQPDFSRLAKIDTRGIIVTAPSSQKGIDFVSRFFAPRVGINEDPVTGSAHCCLGPYWQGRLGKDTLIAHQLSKRGGCVHIQPQGERVLLEGRAMTILRGTLL